MIRNCSRDDEPAIMKIAATCGLFEPEQLDVLRETFRKFAGGSLDRQERWVCHEHDDRLDAVGYFVEEPMTDRVWNLLFIAVDPEARNRGLGGSILKHVEDQLREDGGRMLIIETASGDDFESTRTFYARHDYEQEGHVRDFYETGVSKIVFRKLL